MAKTESSLGWLKPKEIHHSIPVSTGPYPVLSTPVKEAELTTQMWLLGTLYVHATGDTVRTCLLNRKVNTVIPRATAKTECKEV